jgi:hypothetical protein
MHERTVSIVTVFCLCLSCAALSAAKDAKLKPEELVAKHLAALGTPEAIAAVKSRVLSGDATAIFRLGSQGQMSGPGNILSEGRRTRIAIKFQSVDYPGEQLAWDGSKVTVGILRPGRRSNLSSFVDDFDMLLKEGLLGGELTTAWALLDVAGRSPKLDYSGVKKVEGKQLHELRYRARKGPGDLSVSLYFEPETFRHAASQYRLVQPAPMASSPGASSGQRDSIYTLVESFGDFKEVDGLILPHFYKLVFTIEGQSSTYLADWVIKDAKVTHNVPIEAGVFSVQ